jgi:AmmeMemoRadiSam system protein B
MASVRPAAVAGSFYPSAATELRTVLQDCFENSSLGPHGAAEKSRSIVAGLVPHAGAIYSGPCAAHFFTRLQPALQRIIILGVNHRSRGHRAALSPWSHWQTPLGEITVNQHLNELIRSRAHFVADDANAHAGEHSIEIELPFLQYSLSQFEFVPISLSRLSIDECAELGAAIAAACETDKTENRKTVVLASSDLSHYLSPKRTEELDRLALEPILALDPEGLLNIVAEQEISMCGVIPTAVMLFAVNAMAAGRTQLLQHCHSGDVVPMRKVVGYAAVSIEL